MLSWGFELTAQKGEARFVAANGNAVPAPCPRLWPTLDISLAAPSARTSRFPFSPVPQRRARQTQGHPGDWARSCPPASSASAGPDADVTCLIAYASSSGAQSRWLTHGWPELAYISAAGNSEACCPSCRLASATSIPLFALPVTATQLTAGTALSSSRPAWGWPALTLT